MSDYEAETGFLGEWGRFQKQVFFLLCLTVIPNGLSGLSVVFLADTPPHRCAVPAGANLSAAWRNSSVPLEDDGRRPSRCSRYQLRAMLSFSQSGVEPVDVNLSAVPQEGCVDGWEYDRSVYASTIVSEWDLVCDDRWKNPLTSSVFFVGVLTGSFVSGQLSDRYGRKVVLFVTIAIHAAFTFIQSFSTSWVMFCAAFFIIGLGQISNYMTAFVLGTEVLGPRVRSIFSTAGMCLFFGVGYMLLPLLAFLVRDWRTLLLGLALPGVLCLPLWWYIPESPRWLLSQGRVEEAEAIIRDSAKKNKIQPPATIFSSSYNELQPKRRKALNICDLLRSRNIRWISVTLWMVWNMVTIGYYALSLNTGNLHGDAYFNCFLSAVVEMPAYALSWVMFRWCSRRLSLFSSLLVGGVFLLLVQLIPADLVFLAISLEMIGKFALTIAFAIVYAYTTELYPTVLRNTALGACSMASRIGSIIAPYFIYLRSYSVSLPYILMGSLTGLAALLSLLLPESFGMPLPETIAHMQHFPGCCRKTPSKTPRTEEEGNTPV
ncbi:organic cation/carnitine transporter 2 [Betta splendens]|uniref:Organic cation/carnitine transporter 2 n=1 Tax=Betta splendens TaxID=158456 RepID=A0A6P7PAM1_BETSP|nr:organic cation/carnitine transporter 2 [Betta splendens]